MEVLRCPESSSTCLGCLPVTGRIVAYVWLGSYSTVECGPSARQRLGVAGDEGRALRWCRFPAKVEGTVAATSVGRREEPLLTADSSRIHQGLIAACSPSRTTREGTGKVSHYARWSAEQR